MAKIKNLSFKVVEVREIHISHRVVLVDDDMETNQNIRENAAQGWELDVEYDSTMIPDESWTIRNATFEEIEEAREHLVVEEE